MVAQVLYVERCVMLRSDDRGKVFGELLTLFGWLMGFLLGLHEGLEI